MKKVLSTSLIFVACMLIANNALFAQIVGTNSYLQGRFLEVGINEYGAFGAPPPPATYHPYPAGSSLGEVYDYGHDGFTVGLPAFMGDYTYPGSPYEGWGIQVGGPTGLNWAFTSNGAITGPGSLIGNTASYSNTGGKAVATWVGATAGGQLHINMQTSIDTNASWVVMKVVLTNVGATTLSNVYYFRGCDPDNDEARGGSFTSSNHVTYQNDVDHRVMVSSAGETYTFAYMGLGTKDSRAKAFIDPDWPIDFYDTDMSTLYTGTSPGGSTYSVGTSVTGDYGIGLIFNLGNIAAGDSAVFSYAYIFNGISGLDSALTGNSIDGPSVVCAGSNITLVDGVPGGTWSSSAPGIATIGTGTGIVTGVSAGTTTISYELPGPVYSTFVVTVGATTPTTITGNTIVCTGSTTALSDATAGGAWSCSPASVATITTGGVVSGLSAGTATVSYDLGGCAVATTVRVKGMQIPQICAVTIDSATGKNLVIWNQFLSNNVQQFNIYRENSSSVFVEIDSQASNVYSTYLDTGSYPLVQSYSYQLTALDSCGIESPLDSSTVATTVHLTASLGVGGTINLNWNTYVGAPVTTQKIMRSAGGAPFVNIASVANTVISDTDMTPPTGSLVYQINSVMTSPCSPSARTTAEGYFVSSNPFQIANGTTTGINKQSVPAEVQLFPNPTTDELTIQMSQNAFNTFTITNSIGQQLIQQPLSGTQSKVNVSMLPAGLYYITFRGDNGTEVRKFVKS